MLFANRTMISGNDKSLNYFDSGRSWLKCFGETHPRLGTGQWNVFCNFKVCWRCFSI